MDHQSQTKRNLGIDDDLGIPIGGQLHRISPPITPVFDALQIALDDSGELALLGTNDDEIS